MTHPRRIAGFAALFAVTLAGVAATACETDTHGHASRGHETARGAPAAEQSFLAENDAAMERMMADMTITASGDISRDFALMMIPHHQGAIDMAIAYLRHGSDPQFQRIAQEIIVEQVQEIAAMRMAIGEPVPASAPVPTQAGGPVGQPAPITDHAAHQ